MFELGLEEATAGTAAAFDDDEGFIAGLLTEIGKEVVFTELIRDTENETDFVPDDGMTVERIGIVEETAFVL